MLFKDYEKTAMKKVFLTGWIHCYTGFFLQLYQVFGPAIHRPPKNPLKNWKGGDKTFFAPLFVTLVSILRVLTQVYLPAKNAF